MKNYSRCCQDIKTEIKTPKSLLMGKEVKLEESCSRKKFKKIQNMAFMGFIGSELWLVRANAYIVRSPREFSNV